MKVDIKNLDLIIDPAFKTNSYVLELITGLKKSEIHAVTYFYDLPFEPDYDSLDKVKYIFKNENSNESYIDVIIAIGGGSVIDFAKGIATLIHNHDVAISYKGFPKNLNPSVPVIAVPTTAGTASEVTFNAVFTDTKAGRKLGINTHNNFPVLAILDSNMTANCPYNVALSSGLDALVHAFESYACNKSNYYTKIFSKEAIGLVEGRYLELTSAYDTKDFEFFSKTLPSIELWRLWSEFSDKFCFLDIETTGISAYSVATVVSIYQNSEIKTYERGKNLEFLFDEIQKDWILVTYNGKRFDIPFLEREFRVKFENPHLDLMNLLHSLGIKGGLKNQRNFLV